MFILGVLRCSYYTFLVWFSPFQTPLTESLIEFTDPAMNRVAADLFLCKFSPSVTSPLITSSYYIWAPIHPLLKWDVLVSDFKYSSAGFLKKIWYSRRKYCWRVCVCPGCVICVAVMRFMGDSPSRGSTEQEVVSTFLKVNTHRCFFL